MLVKIVSSGVLSWQLKIRQSYKGIQAITRTIDDRVQWYTYAASGFYELP